MTPLEMFEKYKNSVLVSASVENDYETVEYILKSGISNPEKVISDCTYKITFRYKLRNVDGFKKGYVDILGLLFRESSKIGFCPLELDEVVSMGEPGAVEIFLSLFYRLGRRLPDGSDPQREQNRGKDWPQTDIDKAYDTVRHQYLYNRTSSGETIKILIILLKHGLRFGNKDSVVQAIKKILGIKKLPTSDQELISVLNVHLIHES